MDEDTSHIGKRPEPAGPEGTRVPRVLGWIYPSLAAVLVLAVGIWSIQILERETRDEVRDRLQSFLAAKVHALRLWLEEKKDFVEVISRDGRFAALARQVLEAPGAENGAAPDAAPGLSDLRRYLAAVTEARRYESYMLVGRTGRIVAAARDDLIGTWTGPASGPVLGRVMAGGGEAVILPPFRPLFRPAGDAAAETVAPVILAAAPVRTDAGEAIGAFGFGIRPDEFGGILELAPGGSTGETYAFDARGVLLSRSRFEEQLRAAGLFDGEASSSSLAVQVRDPGGDLLAGYRPRLPVEALPLTRMAAEAIAKRPGVDIDGYAGYLGIPVVGAWTWLDDFGFGVAFEMEKSETFRHVRRLRIAFWSLFALLLAGAGAIAVFSRRDLLLRREISAARRLGQYTLMKKIGEGAMGKVFRARHAFLRRPTAIKLLDSRKSDAESIARFEREAEITSRLNHPNTISIYDFGRTPEGVFYLAMEFIDGLSLARLVKEHGPQPPARTIHILRGMCLSLAEAHAEGLIHRDIKPANVMVCDRAGIADLVKVLDFGLGREMLQDPRTGITQPGMIVGTPLYMPPEAIGARDRIDGRGDLYSVGAVGYFLLCGTSMFEGDDIAEVCARVVTEPPAPPSNRTDRPIPTSLESVIMRCLEKDPAKRFASAGELHDRLAAISDTGTWGPAEAREWWRTRPRTDERGDEAPAPVESPSTKVPLRPPRD